MSRAPAIRHWPLYVVAAAFLAATAFAAARSIERNGGRFVYALDDTYIHFALAENVARHGVWSIDGRGFTPCSSSPLWTLLLASAGAAGAPPAAAAFVLAAGFALAVIAVSYGALARHRLPAPMLFGALFLAAAATPLPTLVFVANEHGLHILLTLVLAVASARVLAADDVRRSRAIPIFLFSALVAASRYEGLFLVATVTALFALRRRWIFAAAASGGSALSVGGFGIYSMLQGGYFLPNSVLLKAKYPLLDLGAKIVAFLGPSLVSEAVKTPEVVLLAGFASILLVLRCRGRRRFWDEPSVLLAIFVAIALAHLDFARTGEFFRYEAYLVAVGVVAAGIAWNDVVAGRAPRVLASVLVVTLVGLPLAWRAVRAYRSIAVATGNIYQQQIQMGLFLGEFYRGEAVAANDIGAIDYLAGIRCVDLWGLADMEVAAARRRGAYGPGTIRDIVRSRGAGLAVVYDKWFERFGGLPSEWVRVGGWTIENNVVCGSPTVSFYATRESSRDRLVTSLRRFSSRLPRDVRQSGPYREER